MSLHQFIASEYALPTLYSPKLHKADGDEIHVFEKEDDLDDLEIIPEIIEETYSDIPYYTSLPHIYSLNFKYTEDRCKRLHSYLLSNCKTGKKCEVWTIWLANSATKKTFRDSILKELSNIKKRAIALNALTLEELREAVEYIDGDRTPTPSKLMIY